MARVFTCRAVNHHPRRAKHSQAIQAALPRLPIGSMSCGACQCAGRLQLEATLAPCAIV